jgi:hypothetical protein
MSPEVDAEFGTLASEYYLPMTGPRVQNCYDRRLAQTKIRAVTQINSGI